MGASRKLQGEIDRVLKKVQEGVDVFDSIWNKVYDTDNANQKEKFEADLKKEIKKLQRYRDQIKTWIQSSEIKDKKVSASYEQALVDSRKLIEREMERFKICEKETKTKAFSKEGLGQQPKTDPKEKAKAETRDWLNNVVGELESQIENFEAELEGLAVKKGKNRPPRLTHLETSIVRHKAHIKKLELILRLLDNDELSPDQVNDVRDFLDDYVERNQDDFDDFNDVDEFYNSLPLDKVESLEDLVIIGGPALSKGAPAHTLKSSVPLSAPQTPITGTTTHQLGCSIQEQADDTASQDSNSDVVARTPPSKTSVPSSNPNKAALDSISVHSSSSPNQSAPLKEEENNNFPVRRPSPSLSDASLVRGINRITLSSQATSSIPLSPGNIAPSNGALGAVSSAVDIPKRNILGADDRLGNTGMAQSLSPLNNKILLPHTPKSIDGPGPVDSSNINETSGVSRVFPPNMVSNMQWRPGSSFQNQAEVGQFRARTEIAPDQREKFLQKLQQVQQHGHSNLLGMTSLSGGNHKQFSAQQQNPLLQQFNPQSQPVPTPSGLGLGMQTPGLGNSSSTPLQQPPNSVLSQSGQGLMSGVTKDIEVGNSKVDELQQQQNLVDDSVHDAAASPGLAKNLINEDDLKPSYAVDSPVVSGSLSDSALVSRDIDLSAGQPLQSNQPSSSVGVIGRRSVADLSTVADNLTGSANPGGIHDRSHIFEMLTSAYSKLPHPKDSERARPYTPRHPAITPTSYPQVQAPIVDNPAFWERLGLEQYGTDTLFFAFYYQQNTYQQYLAARELKKQSWRYHRKYNTWFQRHEEPKVATDDYEKGTYVYFDFHVANDELQQGWCQRIKTDFTFEYNYLEDELNV